MKINLTDLEALLTKDLLTCTVEHDLQQVKSKYLGKKGYLTNLFSSLKEIDPENRKSYGIELNQVKITLMNLIEQKYSELKSNIKDIKLDLDIPARHHQSGSHHPCITCYKKKLRRYFQAWI